MTGLNVKIEVSLQNKKEVENAIEFNKQNKYDFTIICEDDNLVHTHCVLELYKAGYTMYFDNKKMAFTHKWKGKE